MIPLNKRYVNEVRTVYHNTKMLKYSIIGLKERENTEEFPSLLKYNYPEELKHIS